MASGDDQSRKGRRIALLIAAIGAGWVVAIALGVALGLDQRTRALFDLAALAGFGWAIWLLYGLWRDRRKDEG